MSKLANFLEDELMDHVMKNGDWTRPTGMWIGLCDSDPGEAATGGNLSELDGGDYARVSVGTNWATASSRATSNNTILIFPEASAAWGTATHFVVVSSGSGAGNVYVYGEISPNKIIGSGDNPTIASGDLDISFDSGGVSDYLANKLLDHVFEASAYTSPINLYLCACGTTIIDASTGSTIQEPSGGSYERKNENGWDNSSGGLVDNATSTDFVTATASWGEITHSALVDADTNGNLLFYATLDSSQAIGVGDTLRYPTGSANFSLS